MRGDAERLDLPPQARASVARLRHVLAVVRAEAAQAEREVQQLATVDPIAITLQQVPGIGPVLALLIRAEVGEIHRFPTGAHVASDAGLVPRVEMTAGRYRYGRITKRGLRWRACCVRRSTGAGRGSPDVLSRMVSSLLHPDHALVDL